jgi:GTP-binding protein
MNITKATFISSYASIDKLPQSGLAELAFIGRSNVGKSSLINMLTNSPKLAKTSSTPGKTQTINHFLINDTWFLVDLPGFGYAKVSKTMREKWGFMIRDYMLRREQLHNVFVLIDCRVPPQKIDIEFINWLGENGLPLSIVFTKADKLKAAELQKNTSAFLDELATVWEELPPYFITSAEDKTGKEELLNYIGEILDNGF